MKDALLAGLREMGLTLSEAQADALCRYGEALLAQNRVMNLTAITDPTAVARLHFLDALELTRAADLRGRSVLDVGAGAGVPGVVLKLAEPTASLTLLDATEKRMAWLRSLLPELGVEAGIVTARAEDAARLTQYREQFEIVTARAVARLPVLCELCLPFVRPGGLFLAMKGSESAAELSEAKQAVRILGGRTETLHEYTLPALGAGRGGERRAIVVVRKVSHTPERYPRRWAKIRERPL